jgi:nicotinic acid mononucleotide adenylyltransferase
VAVGAFPGSFNPITIAHLAVAEAARDQFGLARVDLVVSRVALAKEDVSRPRLEDRLAVLGAVAAVRPWLGLRVTDARLLAEMAAGYDVLVVGADKWAQLHDPAWYGSEQARDAALAQLCQVAVVPRPPHAGPSEGILAVPGLPDGVSSTAVRTGRTEWMAPEAAEFDARTGAWTDPARYERWLTAPHAG